MNLIIILICFTIFIPIFILILYAIYQGIVRKKGTNKIENELEKKGFNISQKLEYGNLFKIYVDMNNKEIAIGKSYPNTNVTFLNFSQIVDCKITENSNNISSGGLGRAIIGGALAGGVGAVVGANTKKSSTMLHNFSIDIITNDIQNSVVRIKMIDESIDITTYANIYKDMLRFANDVYALIQSIISNNQNTVNEKEQSSKELDKLEELADLKEKGIITEKEFEESKKKILSKL